MPYTIKTVVAPKPGQAALVEVPQEIRDEVDSLYAHFSEHPDQEGYAEFDTVDELRDWQRLAAAYCKHREAGALRLRKKPSKNLPDTHMRFQITADLEENGSRATS
jgi:hypothetical protein